MKSPNEIVAYVARKIGYIYYYRPLMYGGTPLGVDTLLHAYHDIWAEIVGRKDDLERTFRAVLEEERCGSATFSIRFQLDHPEASDIEAARYSAAQWRKISKLLGVPVPYDELDEEFHDFADDALALESPGQHHE